MKLLPIAVQMLWPEQTDRQTDSNEIITYPYTRIVIMLLMERMSLNYLPQKHFSAVWLSFRNMLSIKYMCTFLIVAKHLTSTLNCILYFAYRQFCMELNGLAVKLQMECNPETCTQMTATEQWIFLCAAHKTPKEVTLFACLAIYL